MLRRGAQASRLTQATRVFARRNHQYNFTPNAEKAAAFKSTLLHTEEHAAGTTSLWRNISIATVPLLALCAWYVYPREVKHIHHLEELTQLPDEEWPVEMDYQNARWRRFFWGSDHSLFWGPTNHLKKD